MEYVEPTLAIFLSHWANSHCWQWPNIEKTSYPSGNTASEQHIHASLKNNHSSARLSFLSR